MAAANAQRALAATRFGVGWIIEGRYPFAAARVQAWLDDPALSGRTDRLYLDGERVGRIARDECVEQRLARRTDHDDGAVVAVVRIGLVDQLCAGHSLASQE